MAEEKTVENAAPAAAPETASNTTKIELEVTPNVIPKSDYKLTTWVQGGTTSSRFDNEMAARRADAEKRREEYDKETEIGRTPIEQGGGMVYDHKFADPLMSPKVKIDYVGNTREVLMEMLCELVINDVDDGHLLIFVCPECVMRGRDQQFAQVHANNLNRSWHIDKKSSGMPRRVQDSSPGEKPRYTVYTHAGDIMDTDVLRCPNVGCGCSYKIHKNVMYRVR